MGGWPLTDWLPPLFIHNETLLTWGWGLGWGGAADGGSVNQGLKKCYYRGLITGVIFVTTVSPLLSKDRVLL